MEHRTITQDRLKELFILDVETGAFIRRIAVGGGRYKAGTEVGCKTKDGHVKIGVDRRHYQAQRLVWLWHTGILPGNDDRIFHIDGNLSNNRFENLRLSKDDMPELTVDRLKQLLHYDAHSGEWTWISGNKQKIGTKAGSYCHGYRSIGIDGKTYYSHRLAWFYVYGVWPKNQIDHINGDKSCNRISNLREATNQQNTYNRKANKNNNSGYKGVHFNKTLKKWTAQIGNGRGAVHLGLFDTPERASDAYKAASIKHHGQFARLE